VGDDHCVKRYLKITHRGHKSTKIFRPNPRLAPPQTHLRQNQRKKWG